MGWGGVVVSFRICHEFLSIVMQMGRCCCWTELGIHKIIIIITLMMIIIIFAIIIIIITVMMIIII